MLGAGGDLWTPSLPASVYVRGNGPGAVLGLVLIRLPGHPGQPYWTRSTPLGQSTQIDTPAAPRKPASHDAPDTHGPYTLAPSPEPVPPAPTRASARASGRQGQESQPESRQRHDGLPEAGQLHSRLRPVTVSAAASDPGTAKPDIGHTLPLGKAPASAANGHNDSVIRPAASTAWRGTPRDGDCAQPRGVRRSGPQRDGRARRPGPAPASNGTGLAGEDRERPARDPGIRHPRRGRAGAPRHGRARTRRHQAGRAAGRVCRPGLARPGPGPAGGRGLGLRQRAEALPEHGGAEQNADADADAADRSWDGSTTSKHASRPGKRKQGDTREELSRQRRKAWKRLVRAVADLGKLGIDQGTAEQAVSELSGSLEPVPAGAPGARSGLPWWRRRPARPVPEPVRVPVFGPVFGRADGVLGEAAALRGDVLTVFVRGGSDGLDLGPADEAITHGQAPVVRIVQAGGVVLGRGTATSWRGAFAGTGLTVFVPGAGSRVEARQLDLVAVGPGGGRGRGCC